MPLKTNAELQKRIKAFKTPSLSWQKTEDVLNDMEAEINALYNCLIDGVAILDTEGRVTRINKRLLDIGGYPEKEIVGKKLKNLHMFTQESISGTGSV